MQLKLQADKVLQEANNLNLNVDKAVDQVGIEFNKMITLDEKAQNLEELSAVAMNEFLAKSIQIDRLIETANNIIKVYSSKPIH